MSTQEIILREIRKNPKITRIQLAGIIGISSDGVKYHLQKLSRAGILKRIGSTRYGEWAIIKE